MLLVLANFTLIDCLFKNGSWWIRLHFSLFQDTVFLQVVVWFITIILGFLLYLPAYSLPPTYLLHFHFTLPNFHSTHFHSSPTLTLPTLLYLLYSTSTSHLLLFSIYLLSISFISRFTSTYYLLLLLFTYLSRIYLLTYLLTYLLNDLLLFTYLLHLLYLVYFIYLFCYIWIFTYFTGLWKGFFLG
jgi:hypothetical protein